MDEKFDKLINGMLPNQNQFREKFLKRELQIPGLHITVDGNDVKDILDSKGFSSFVEQDASKAEVAPSSLLNNPVFLDKEKLLTYFNGYSNDADEYFQYNISIIRQIISSMVDLIPPVLNDEGKTIALCCLDFSKMMSTSLTKAIESIRSVLSNDVEDKNLKGLTKLNILRIQKGCLVHGFVELNFLIIYTMWYRQHVYDYFYGPEEEKSEKADMIKQITENVVEQMSLKFTPQFDRIEKNTIQTIKDNKQIINTLADIQRTQMLSDNTLKLKSERIIETVEKKNKADKRKKLTQKVCANVIYKARMYYNNERERYLKENGITKYTKEFLLADENSIKREIQRWDSFLKSDGAKGVPPPERYTRMVSKAEFEMFAESLEWNKYEEWKASIQEKYMTVHRNNL